MRETNEMFDTFQKTMNNNQSPLTKQFLKIKRSTTF